MKRRSKASSKVDRTSLVNGIVPWPLRAAAISGRSLCASLVPSAATRAARVHHYCRHRGCVALRRFSLMAIMVA